MSSHKQGVMAGLVRLVPAIPVLPAAQKTWMRGTTGAFTRVFDAQCLAHDGEET
jgi:hypothetical protein